jgi:hypothetical protein
VWEVDVLSNRPDKNWPYDFTVRFFGVQTDVAEIDSWSEGDGELVVTNVFERPLPVVADGTVEGFRMFKEDKFKGLKDELSYSVTLDERFSSLRIDLEMTPEAYATTTDIGVAVETEDGKAVFSDGFSTRTFRETVEHPQPGETVTLKVVIRGGFAVADDKRETPLTVKLDQLLADPLALKVTRDKSAEVDLIPGVPIKLEYALDGTLPAAPKGTRPVGYLRLRERNSKDEALRVVVDIAE